MEYGYTKCPTELVYEFTHSKVDALTEISPFQAMGDYKFWLVVDLPL